jgi:uncharacterized protein YjbK
MCGAREDEVKLALEPGEFTRLLAHLGPADRELHQVNHYFDSPDGFLGRNGVVLRAREDVQRVLTVKIGRNEGEGLFCSREHERPLGEEELAALVEGRSSPLELFPELSALLPSPRPAIRYLGAVENHRRLYHRPGGWEITLDETRFPVGPLDHELEVELQGTTGDPVGEIREIFARLGLVWRPQSRTKYERFLERIGALGEER